MSDAIHIELVAQGMVTLRGDLASASLAKAVKAAVGCTVPGQRQVLVAGENVALWMSPDELLLLVRHDKADDVVAHLGKSMAGEHHLAVNVSDARAMFRLQGQGAREVLAKGAPVDLAPGQFEPWVVRRTRIGLVAAAFWMTEADTFEIVCFRSVAGYMEDWLHHAARKDSLPGVFS